MLALDLRRYIRAVDSHDIDVAGCVAEAGASCTKCGSGRCARESASRRRKRITDLSTGDVFENVLIRRVVFCDGRTASLMPAELWRGQFTVTSVVETGVHILPDGVAAAYDWCWDAGPDGSPVSLPTLARWRTLIRQRLLCAALPALNPQLGWSSSDCLSEASRLE